MKKITLLIVTLFLATIMVGCSNGEEEDANSGTKAAAANEGYPEKIVYALIPTEDQEEIVSKHEAFAEYLSEEIDVPVEIFSGTDYNANIEAMRNGHVHIAYFGPFSYLLAKERANAEAFAVHLKTPDAEPYYTSEFITLEGNGIDSIDDLEGNTFAWADPTSTSGYMYPRAHLINELGLTNDTIDSHFSQTVFSGSHEASVLSVLNEDVKAAAISSGSGQRAIENYADHRNGEKIFVFESTADIPSSPYTMQGDLPEELKEAIKEAFYKAIDEPSLSTYFEEAAMEGGFIPVEDAEYDVVEQTADALGLSPEELLAE